MRSIDLSAIITKDYCCTLRQLRLEKLIYQTELADLTGISAQKLCLIESGANFPTVYQLLALKQALGVTLDELMVKRHSLLYIDGGRELSNIIADRKHAQKREQTRAKRQASVSDKSA